MRIVAVNGMVLKTCITCPHFFSQVRDPDGSMSYARCKSPDTRGEGFFKTPQNPSEIPDWCPLPRELEHEASEEILTPADREILDKGMEEITALGAWPEDYEHISQLRNAIVTMSLRFNYSLRDAIHVLYCIVSAGISKEKILATLRFCFKLSAKLRVSPAVAENMVTCFVNAGLMNGDKIGEPGVYSLRGIDFQPPRMLKPEGKEAEAESPGRPGWLQRVFEDYAAKLSKTLETAIKAYGEAARKTEVVLAPLSKEDAPEGKPKIKLGQEWATISDDPTECGGIFAVLGQNPQCSVVWAVCYANGELRWHGEGWIYLNCNFIGETPTKAKAPEGGASAVDGLTSWAAAWLSPEEIEAYRPEWQKTELEIAKLAEELLKLSGYSPSTYHTEPLIWEGCFHMAEKFVELRKKRMAEAQERAKEEAEKEKA